MCICPGRGMGMSEFSISTQLFLWTVDAYDVLPVRLFLCRIYWLNSDPGNNHVRFAKPLDKISIILMWTTEASNGINSWTLATLTTKPLRQVNCLFGIANRLTVEELIDRKHCIPFDTNMYMKMRKFACNCGYIHIFLCMSIHIHLHTPTCR